MHIKDDGIGIAKEDFPTLFTRFGKLHRTAEQNSTGIGLGLMIVKQIVEKNGGKIEVYSDGIGKGTCIMFSMKMDLIHEDQCTDAINVFAEQSSSLLDRKFTNGQNTSHETL